MSYIVLDTSSAVRYNHSVKNLIQILKSKNPDLKEAEILGILYIINSKENLTNNELVRTTGLPKAVLSEFKSSMSEYLKPSRSDEVLLNEKGLEEITKLDLKPYKWSLLSREFEEFEQRIRQIRNKYKLNPKREYDQFFATPKSTIGKARMLLDKGLVEGKNIALIGDDDIVSLALGLMSPNFRKIKVFDIDQRILGIVEKAAKELDIKDISTQLHDIRKPLPNLELNKYDVVLIDPPYTRAGAQLFLHRSIELLREKNSYDRSYILFNFGVGFKKPEAENKVQEVINNFGLVIEDKINKYTRYHGAETVGSASSMYVLKTTQFTSVDKSVLPQKIYTFEKTDVEKFPFTDHYTFKISQAPSQIVNSKTKLQKVFGDFCRIHRLKVVSTSIDKFKGGGFSLTFILATSNLLVHTWPERSAIHVDLLTCAPIYNKENLGQNLSKLLKTQQVEVRWIE